MKKLKSFLKKSLPFQLIIFYNYVAIMKKVPNIIKPKTYSEKVTLLMMSGKLESYKNLVCKYQVRQYVKERIGESYLINLINNYNDASEIDFDSLPNQFVLKCSHGCGYNIIIKDKRKINNNNIINELNTFMKQNYYENAKEVQYKNIVPKIICEEYLEDETGSLKDYKIFCFNGEPSFIEVHNDRYHNHTVDIYNTDWEKINVSRKKDYPVSVEYVERPAKLNEMLEVARKLAKNINFVRVDLYYTNNKIYFGEMTFTPGKGHIEYMPYDFDKKIANMIN